jgi:chaperonin GroES
MKMNVRPLADRVVVKRIESDTQTAGGIYIPDTAKEKPAECVVEAVGPGKASDNGNRVALQVSVNDRVLFGKYSGTEIKVAGQELIILREDEILGIVTD